MRAAISLLLVLSPLAVAQRSASAGLVVGVMAQCGLSILTEHEGTLTFRYHLRTGRNGGGAIAVRATDPAATLTYTLRLAAVTHSGSISPATTAPVVTFGPDAHSLKEGDSGTLVWQTSRPSKVLLTIDCH